MAKYCQDCGDTLGGRTSCACGWAEPDQKSRTQKNQAIMCYAHGCPLPGTLTESVSHKSAMDARWYCIHHWRVIVEPHKYRAITEDLIKTPPAHQIDWHDEMVNALCDTKRGVRSTTHNG